MSSRTRALRLSVSTIGAVTGVAGVEHGVGEILQGNVAPEATTITSWPDSEAFRILGGEPTMTIVPNLLVTGILAIISSLAYVAWATAFVERKHAGRVLVVLAIVMLLVGGGFGPPLLGVGVGAVATGVNTPLAWWREHLPGGLRRPLAGRWPWILGADIAAWLALVPGVPLVAYFVGSDAVPATLVWILIASAFGILPLVALAAIAADLERGAVPATAPR